ncbi:MAG: hypothetical protein LBJ23_00360 [Tannerella sp.]|jgi:hypothetical protein|nr:hypothetical protein [Tannerella sp.]
MKTVIFALVAFAGTVTFSSCSNAADEELRNQSSLHFDKNNLTFEAAESSAAIRILDAKEWGNEACGVDYVLITTAEGDTAVFTNTFEVKNSGNLSYNVHVNPFVGESFRVERKGEEIHLQLSENTGSERRFKMQINAGMYGSGEIWVTQKGK